jgi:hypothetical protein
MALIVEDGTARADAESYISVADADTYFANRGNAAWAALDTTAKEQALRAGTDYMRQTYRLHWTGMRVTGTQALDWPRAWVALVDAPSGYRSVPSYVPLNVIPPEIKNACAELAVRSIAAPLSPDLGPQVVREQVGPVSVDYLPGGRQALRYTAIDAMLSPYLKGRGALDVVRA